jgi:maltose O-acetyltransferase
MEYLRVGDQTFISDAYIALNAPLTIGNYVTVNQDVTILTATHGLDDPRWRAICKEVRIDDYAWIATGAMLMPGTHIGRGAVVGAGAVVRGEVPPYSVMIGNPATATSKRRTERLEYSPVAFLAAYEAWLDPGTHAESAV